MTAEVPPSLGEGDRERDRSTDAYASRARPVTAEEQRSRFRLSRRQEQILLALIVVAGLLLRFHDYTAAPRPSDNTDELAWTWAGISLWHGEGPTSWSYLLAYPHQFPLIEPDNGRVLPGVHPWLDHPPTFALLIGGFALLAGERSFADVSTAAIRVPVILLSLLTLVLTYWFGRSLFGPLPAMIAAVLFAVAPGAVLESRQVESEALLAPMLLVMLILCHRIIDDKATPREPTILLAVCGLAPLVKVPGAAYGVIAALVLASSGRRRLAALAVWMSCLGLLIFVWYGLLVDWRQFLAVMLAQSSRHSGLISGYEFITSAAGNDVVRLRDGWWILGWLGLVVAAWQRTRPRQPLLLGWPVVAFALTIMLLAEPTAADKYGWYRFPIYPLVYLLAAHFVVESVRRPNVVRMSLLVLLPGAAATLGLISGVGGWNSPVGLLLIVVTTIVGAGAVAALVRHRNSRTARLPQLLAGAALAGILALNVAQSIGLREIYTALS